MQTLLRVSVNTFFSSLKSVGFVQTRGDSLFSVCLFNFCPQPLNKNIEKGSANIVLSLNLNFNIICTGAQRGRERNMQLLCSAKTQFVLDFCG